AELRAYREAQQRAWGDLDSVVLGRYLAGEVDGDERRQVEAALDELPELRRLTDLVRDVLGDGDPALARDEDPAPPVCVPLPARRPARPSGQRWRQRAALVAAACLLLALGSVVPRPFRES